MNLQQRFGLVIRNRRKTLGLTLEVLAFRLQMHPNYVRDVEHGRKNCRLSTLERFANEFKVDVYDLLVEANKAGEQRSSRINRICLMVQRFFRRGIFH